MLPAHVLSSPPDRANRVSATRFTALCVIAFTLAAAATVELAAAPGDRKAASPLPHAEQPLSQYRALRRMHAWSERFNQEAWMDAWTSLENGRFKYTVVSERGSDTIRKKVLHAMLDREQDLVNSGECARADLTEQNYDFDDPAVGADGATVVPIKARRKDVLLVDGRMVLDPASGDLLRVEGRLAKNPSFWTSLVNIVRRYARVAGVRVPVSTDTTAKIKFAGTSQLEVRYEYESVNGRPAGVVAARR